LIGTAKDLVLEFHFVTEMGEEVGTDDVLLYIGNKEVEVEADGVELHGVTTTTVDFDRSVIDGLQRYWEFC